MNSRVRRAALHIALLREEFTEIELQDAVRWLEAQGSTSALLTFLANQETPKPNASDQASQTKERFPWVEHALRATDPERHVAIEHFLRATEEGSAKVSYLRRLGMRLSKDFRSAGTRQDILVKLVELLVCLPPGEVHQLTDDLISSTSSVDTGYQQLSQHIINGIGSNRGI
jgi:hypothetical protein